jgi:hypothetical protein
MKNAKIFHALHDCSVVSVKKASSVMNFVLHSIKPEQLIIKIFNDSRWLVIHHVKVDLVKYLLVSVSRRCLANEQTVSPSGSC